MESFGQEETPEEKEEPIYIGDVFPEITPENLSAIREFALQVREIRALPEPPSSQT